MTRQVWAPSGWQGLAGVGRCDITPPVGIRAKNWGAAKSQVSTGNHRPLMLTALALKAEAESEPLVLITADLLGWSRTEDEWFLRGAVIDAHDLDPARVMVHLVHTHAGPSTCAADVDEPGGSHVPGYLRQLRDAAVEATRGRSTVAFRRPSPPPPGDAMSRCLETSNGNIGTWSDSTRAPRPMTPYS